MVDITAPPSRIGAGDVFYDVTVLNDMTVQGDLTVEGAFTSPGIDDNATTTQVTIEETDTTIAASGVSRAIFGSTGVTGTTGVWLPSGLAVNLAIGGDSNDASTLTNATQKIGRVATPHYTNAEEPMALFLGESSSTTSTVRIGGGSSLLNAATSIEFYTAANSTTTTGTVRASIDASGNLLVGATSGSAHTIDKAVSLGSPIVGIGDGSFTTVRIDGTNTAGENAANTGLRVRSNGTTGRSINASGTINASGADYAEYELRADSCGEFAKGDVVGFDVNGKLTDVFADAVSFAIKSTNPSYVGGDTWHDGIERPEQPVLVLPEYEGAEPSPLDEDGEIVDQAQQDQYEADQAAHVQAVAAAQAAYGAEFAQWELDLAAFELELEAKRQLVDRIAYAGKVPVNGIDGATPGHKVLAVDDGSGGIKAATKATPTLSEYMKFCIGTVRTNGSDGRAIVEVKMG